ncbi:hypothetical protein TcG_04027 [Trypanosoma cruzi]|nr:hypothetical protein TcG_04027 [Trypanosoma cruzi]
MDGRIADCGLPPRIRGNWPWHHGEVAGIAEVEVDKKKKKSPHKASLCLGGLWSRDAHFRMCFPPPSPGQALCPLQEYRWRCGAPYDALAPKRRRHNCAVQAETRSTAPRNGWLLASRRIPPVSFGT